MSTVNPATSRCMHVFLLLFWFLPLPLSCRTADSANHAEAVKTSAVSTQTLSAGAAPPSPASDNLTNTFRSSLEMKEGVDFLLTPAILVQQAMRDDAIIIYPSE